MLINHKNLPNTRKKAVAHAPKKIFSFALYLDSFLSKKFHLSMVNASDHIERRKTKFYHKNDKKTKSKKLRRQNEENETMSPKRDGLYKVTLRNDTAIDFCIDIFLFC